MSEMIADLANDILACPTWNLEEVHSPHKNKIPAAKILADNIPFEPALPANVAILPLTHGKVNCYIDDIVPIILQTGKNSEKGANAIPLAMYTVRRPVHPNEFIPGNDLFLQAIWQRKLGGDQS